MRQLLILIGAWMATSGLLLAQERPELSLQRGHTDEAVILACALSRDLRFTYTVGSDGTVKVWDSDTGQIVRTIYDSKSYPDKDDHGKSLSGAFPSSADWVVTLDGAGTVRRFSLPDGKLLHSFQALDREPGYNESSLILTDGEWLYLLADTSLEKFALDGTSKVKRDVPGDYRFNEIRPEYASLSEDGKVLGVATTYQVRLYQTSDLELILAKETESPLRAVSVSPDSNRFAYLSGTEFVQLEKPGWTEKGRININSQDNWSIEKRGLLWYRDELYAFTVDEYLNEPLARVDFGASKLDVVAEDAYAVCFSITPDSKILFGRYNGDAWIYDPSTKDRRTFASDIGGFTSLDLDPKSGDLFTGTRQGEVWRWSSETGRIDQRYKGLKKSYVSSVNVSPDGTKVLGADYSLGVIKCWDVNSGETISTVDLQSSRYGMGVVWTEWIDNETYTYSAVREPLKSIDAKTGQEKVVWEVEGSRPRAIDVKDGRLVVGYDSNRLMESSATSKRDAFLKQLPDGKYSHVAAVTYGATNQTVYCIDSKGRLFKWNVAEPESDPLELGRVEGDVRRLEFHEGSLRVWLNRGKILTLDTNGKQLASMELADDDVWGQYFDTDDTIMAIAGFYKLGFYDAKSGVRKGKLVSVRNNTGWVALESSGSFDGNDVGLSTIQFALDGELYGVDQFMTQYLRPGILAELLPSGPKSLRTSTPLTSSTLKKPPTVRITEPASGATISGDNVTVEIEISDRGAGASAPHVYHNGHKLPEAGLKKIDGNRFQYEVDLVQGSNEIQATAFDSSNQVESRRDRVRVTAPDVAESAPKLHLLSVGIDTYGSGMKLEFADEDAQSISELFQSDIYSPGTRTLLKNNEATREGIKEAIARLAEVAEPQDAFVFYLAGHGTVVDDTYYFLPQDVQTGSDQDLQGTALSADLLGSMLAAVPATKQLLVLDTCRAGKLIEGGKIYARPGLEEVRSHNLLSRTSGTFLIAATKEKDYAFEVPQLGHGILTYSVLETLGVKGAKGESAVTANELLRAVSQKVPELSQKYNGTRQSVVQYSSGQDFPLTK